MFEPQQKIEVSSIAELNLPLVVQRAFTITPVYTQEPESDGSFKTVSPILFVYLEVSHTSEV